MPNQRRRPSCLISSAFFRIKSKPLQQLSGEMIHPFLQTRESIKRKQQTTDSLAWSLSYPSPQASNSGANTPSQQSTALSSTSLAPNAAALNVLHSLMPSTSTPTATATVTPGHVAKPPFAPTLDAAMSKRDEIAKTLASLGPGGGGGGGGNYQGHLVPSVPGPSSMDSLPERYGGLPDRRHEAMNNMSGGGGGGGSTIADARDGERTGSRYRRNSPPPRDSGWGRYGEPRRRRSRSPSTSRMSASRPMGMADQVNTSAPVGLNDGNVSSNVSAAATTTPVNHVYSSSSNGPRLDDLDVAMLNPMEASTWEKVGQAWTNTHGRPPEGPDAMMWFMNATAAKMGGGGGGAGPNPMNMMMGMPGMSMGMGNDMANDGSHQQARMDWNDEGPYSSGGGGGGSGRGRW